MSAVDRPVVRARAGEASDTALPRRAPYAAVRAEPLDAGPLTLALTGPDLQLRAVYDGEHCHLELDGPTGPVVLRSRRAARVGPAAAVALCLTGTHVGVLTQERPDGPWTGRARTDLARSHRQAARLVRDDAWLDALRVGHEGAARGLVAGGFGQLGLRDLRLVTQADGRPYDDGTGLLRFLATSAGPGPFGSGHASVWALDPSALEHGGGALTHTADLFVRRRGSGAVLGDHAGHLLRDGDAWVLATSTWGDFDPDPGGPRHHTASVAVTLATSQADLLTGVHVVDGRPLALPADPPSVGVWDPHLLRTGEGWLVGYVSATRFFRFHPVLAEGPDLDRLALRAADPRRRATEGTTLLAGSTAGSSRTTVLVSDGRDGPRRSRGRWSALDLDLRPAGVLEAAYPTNIPWPTLAPHGEGWLLVTFDGTRHGGRVCGYGTHGDVVVLRGAGRGPRLVV